MEKYAVIETGGKQYRVQEGDTFDIERLDAEEGEKIELDNILAVSDGEKLNVGTPLVEGAKVSAKVVKLHRGKKVVAFKFKQRKGYRRKVGHRQELTRIEIEKISA